MNLRDSFKSRTCKFGDVAKSFETQDLMIKGEPEIHSQVYKKSIYASIKQPYFVPIRLFETKFNVNTCHLRRTRIEVRGYTSFRLEM